MFEGLGASEKAERLVLTQEMAVQPDLLPLQERVARLQSLIAAGQFESSAVTEYADDVERISLAINSLRETDPVVRQKQLQRYENALMRIGEALVAAETEPMPTTSEESMNDPESVKEPAVVESNVVDVAEGERLMSEVNEAVQPLFALAKEHLRRDGTPEHVEALKLISTLRLRYYQLDQAEQALKQAGDNDVDVAKLGERVHRAHDAIRTITNTLHSLPVMNGLAVRPEAPLPQTEIDTVADTQAAVVPTASDETMMSAVESVETFPSEGEPSQAEAESIILSARELAFTHAESNDAKLREKAKVLLGAIRHYEANGHEHTLRDIEKHSDELRLLTTAEESIVSVESSSERVLLPEYLKAKWGKNKQFLLALVFAAFPQSAPNETVLKNEVPVAQQQNYFDPAWSSEIKESPVTERVMINDGVLPQVETGIVEVTKTGEQFAKQSDAVEATLTTLDVHTREGSEQDVVFKETGIKIEEPEQIETPVAFFGKDATYIPADPNIILDEERPLVTGSLPNVDSNEPLTEKVFTTEEIPPEKIKFVAGGSSEYYLENYWFKLVEGRSSDIAKEEHDKLVRQVLNKARHSKEMRLKMGFEEDESIDDVKEGRLYDLSVLLDYLRELESFKRMGVSEPPAPLDAAEEYAVSEGAEAPVSAESESTSPEGEGTEAPVFDEARFRSWLSENFNIDQNERWFSSMFSSGFDNKSLLNLTIGEATELSLMNRDELASELVARKIDINVFNKLNGLIVSARRTGELPSEVKNDRLVSDFLAEQFTKLTA